MAEIGPVVMEPTAENIRNWLVGHVAYYLDETAGTVDPGAPLAGYGLDSISEQGLRD
jgi:aryl carrier-like protein